MSIPVLSHVFFSNESADECQNLALLKAFEDLREKLKVQSKENTALKNDLKVFSIKVRQSDEALSATLTANMELKEHACSLQSQNEELKKKLTLLKETVQGQSNYREEVEFAKEALLQVKTQCDALEKERQKLLEVSVGEKLQLEEEVTRLHSKLASHQQYMQELEGSSSKCRETLLRLENEMKKAKITYEEEAFTQKWTQGNFETEHLMATIKDLQREVTGLKAKNRKEKEKRVLLEDRVIELEELSGFHTVKADTFQGEADLLTQKYHKAERKYKEAKHKAERTAAEKLQVEENLAKTIMVFEELSKKLQEMNNAQVCSLLQQSHTKLSFLSPLRQEINEETSSIQKSTTRFMERSATTVPSPAKPPQTAFPRPLEPHNGWEGRQEKGDIHGNTSMYGSNMTFGEREAASENVGIENRVRKEREEMERRIKEKMLSRKLESSAPSEQYRLRDEYIRTFIDRRL